MPNVLDQPTLPTPCLVRCRTFPKSMARRLHPESDPKGIRHIRAVRGHGEREGHRAPNVAGRPTQAQRRMRPVGSSPPVRIAQEFWGVVIRI